MLTPRQPAADTNESGSRRIQRTGGSGQLRPWTVRDTLGGFCKQGSGNQGWSASDGTVKAGQRAYADTADQDPALHVTSAGADAQNAYQNDAQPHGQYSDLGLHLPPAVWG